MQNRNLDNDMSNIYNPKLVFPRPRIHRETNCPKRQTRHRGTPREEIQEERGLQDVDDHQEGQDDAHKHENQAEAEKEVGRVHLMLLAERRSERSSKTISQARSYET